MNIVVSDTTALIIFAKSSSFCLLENLFSTIFVPQAVYDEISYKDDIVKYSLNSSKQIKLKPINNTKILRKIQKEKLDIGEIEAISLALELDLPLIIDEVKGRKIALKHGLKIVGCLGILIENYRQNKISLEQTKYYFELFKNNGLRISVELEKVFFERLELKN